MVLFSTGAIPVPISCLVCCTSLLPSWISGRRSYLGVLWLDYLPPAVQSIDLPWDLVCAIISLAQSLWTRFLNLYGQLQTRAFANKDLVVLQTVDALFDAFCLAGQLFDEGRAVVGGKGGVGLLFDYSVHARNLAIGTRFVSVWAKKSTIQAVRQGLEIRC